MWNWKTRTALLLAVLLLGLILWWLIFLRGFGTVTLATGQKGGTYTELGGGLAAFVNESDTRFKMETRSSQGSAENLRLLADGEADFAILQSGQVSSDEVRVVAKLYTEVLHIMVHQESLDGLLSGLGGSRLSLGESGSGSRVVSRQILNHFGVVEYEEVPLPPEEALLALQRRELDAVFLVSALQSDVVRRMVKFGEIRFLRLTYADSGLVARYPFLVKASIPAMTYPCPSKREGAMPLADVPTVGVPSLLVCRKDVPAEVVYEFTKKLFASRSKLSAETPEAYQIAEITAGDLLPWSVHEGAQRYYRRREPGFLERYAEVMAFMMSLGAAAWAVWGTVSKWSSRKKKNRIDDYYLEVAAAFLRLDEDLSLVSLAEERSRLRGLRSRAFKDLAAERLKADDSFGIFQDQLALCLEDVRRREERLRAREEDASSTKI